MPMDKIAVVILNWNGCDMLRSFLPSVVEHSVSEEAVVYVADNGSTDGSVDMLRREFPTVRLILLDRNYGFAEGYNRALHQVEARYAVLLNSDVEVTPDWLSPLYRYMEDHPLTAACQPKIRSWHRKDMFEYAGAAGGYMDRYGYPFCRGRMFGAVEADCGQYDSVAQVFWASGAAMFVRLSDYWNAGGLDSRFFAHMEEIDLCWRLRARGKELVCIPSSVVYHVGAATLKKESPRKTYLNFRNNLLMLYKNLPAAELRPVMRMRWWFDCVAALNFLLHGQGSNVAALFRARSDYRKLRASYRSVRQDNLSKAMTSSFSGRMPFCLLWQYYIKGVRSFLQLDTSAIRQQE